ncbi:hypothetical protein Taro_016760 [Colocasia esculenta]|uniref:ER membrane protein complex subunit 3 n=1 Tax=Colocasia esculenta TaxID=4460 RepID=A0A843UR57_COLES|nr:hypothetical protein [Colocasia esculenta]
MAGEDLVLDTAIRDWVLIPLSVVMVLIGVLRYFVSKLMRSHQSLDQKVVREGQVIVRARNLRAGANFIPTRAFSSRKFYFTNECIPSKTGEGVAYIIAIELGKGLVTCKVGNNMVPCPSPQVTGTPVNYLESLGYLNQFLGAIENGLLHVPKGQAQNAQAQMFSDPNMAMDMMKKNLSMIIPQTLTFAWVNFFFSGFVAGVFFKTKIPFPLTQRFRSMLQNGIDLSTVDVSYVSSRSWYFLNLFGLRGLFSLILGEENAADDAQRMMQMGGFGFDPSKSLGAEKDGIDIIQHDWALPKFEQRAEAVLRKLVK